MILDGRAVAQQWEAQIRTRTQAWTRRHGRVPGLSVVLVGDDPASQVYVAHKVRACERVGVVSRVVRLPHTTHLCDLVATLTALSEDPKVDGVLLQLPLPAGLDVDQALAAVNPNKDVDGLSRVSLGLLAAGRPCLSPCTPRGIIHLLGAYSLELVGKHCVILGRSRLVGWPLSKMLLDANATVTVAHSRSADLARLCVQADVLIAATGRRHLVAPEWVRPGAVVIDVGIHRNSDGTLTGDVSPQARARAGAWTPVPGGVGPMTIAALLENTLSAAELRLGTHGAPPAAKKSGNIF